MNNKKEYKKRIKIWKDASKALEEERIKQIKASDTQKFIQSTSGILKIHFKKFRKRDNSGLIEQQYYFSKGRK